MDERRLFVKPCSNTLTIASQPIYYRKIKSAHTEEPDGIPNQRRTPSM